MIFTSTDHLMNINNDRAPLRWWDTVLMRFMTLQGAIYFQAKSICADGVAVCALFV